MHRTLLAFLAFTLIAACASPQKRGPGFGAAPVSLAGQAERILSDARSKRAENSCEAAAPSFRVVASFGKGYDVAQYELGECLLEIDDPNPIQSALHQEEARLWLRRAAWAGNARAQLALADHLSATANNAVANANLIEAYGWALIYQDNAAHALYGLPSLSAEAKERFATALDETMKQSAHAFAADFRQFEMAVFQPPLVASGARAARQSGGRAPQGRRRR
ncbi:MAG: hypothetical protein AAGD92_10305 [Pseudomonadota bacterium]